VTTLLARPLGDIEVSAIGMGAMTLTQVAGYDAKRGIRAVHAAVDAGITFFDTADSYGQSGTYGENELALVRALRLYGGALDRVVIATKGGHTRHENGSWWIDGSPTHLASAARHSLRRLGLESLPLYQLHRPDPRRDFAESLMALRLLHEQGLVQRVGISNVSVDQLARAREILGPALVSVQNELSSTAPDDGGVLSASAELGLAFLAWGPLGGMRSAKSLGSHEQSAFAQVAADRRVSPQRIALAWLLARAPHIIPIPGASRPQSIRDSAGAVEIELTADELRRLGESEPIQ
jgi:aryl-alcohol dehydrogenase-like predicted oxidoreductase